jgi:peptide/nickel transport system ATP-binding protein
MTATAPTTSPATAIALRVEDLSVHYETKQGIVRAVDHVNFDLASGERLGLVGESGSGKSTIALALMQMIKPPGKIAGGRILLGDADLAGATPEQMRKLRLAKIALVPQGAMNSLNPVMRIKSQLIDGVIAHDGRRRSDRAWLDRRVEELLESVGLRREVGDRYPHELSGGMKQRVCIATAIAMEPSVIIADEPTSALDVVVQRQIMQTLGAIQRQLGAAVILIGHDMGMMAQFVDRVGVMYGGKLVETSATRPLFANPHHPYTQALISSIPTFEAESHLVKIPGQPHSPLHPPPGCVFHPRCARAMPVCSAVIPLLKDLEPGRKVACHLYDGAGDDVHAAAD